MSARFRSRRCSPVTAVGIAAAMLTTFHSSLASSQPAATVPASEARPSIRSRPLADATHDRRCARRRAWREAPLETGEWRSYNPLLRRHASRSRRRSGSPTTRDYLYFAFQCDDPEPSGIKTSITRRDNIWSDDWVGLSLDALGTGQLSYHLMVNPSGVQLDMLNSVAGGRGSVAGLRVGQRRAAQRRRATRSRSGCRCRSIRFRGGRRRADGHPVLAARQPRSACRCRGRRSSRASGCSSSMRRCCSTSCSRGSPREVIPSDDLRAKPGARRRRRAGATPTTTATSASAPSTASRRRSRSTRP